VSLLYMYMLGACHCFINEFDASLSLSLYFLKEV
jgi:hypothetical protein